MNAPSNKLLKNNRSNRLYSWTLITLLSFSHTEPAWIVRFSILKRNSTRCVKSYHFDVFIRYISRTRQKLQTAHAQLRWYLLSFISIYSNSNHDSEKRERPRYARTTTIRANDHDTREWLRYARTTTICANDDDWSEQPRLTRTTTISMNDHDKRERRRCERMTTINANDHDTRVCRRFEQTTKFMINNQ